MRAVQKLARNEWQFKHRYAMTLHTDDDHPHVHVVVKAVSETGERLNIELIDLPFPAARSYRIRVNGEWAKKVPVASKTMVAKQLRAWLVKH